MTLANANALFCGLKSDPSYLANLTISDTERTKLLDARRLIRNTLRAATRALAGDEHAWRVRNNRGTVHGFNELTIKFMTQGSFAYKTLNAPAQVPQQEIDLDDGMYVPVTFLEDGEPALAAKGLYEFVTRVLDPLCKEQGWVLEPKDTCVRIGLWTGAHVDMPIYSIPQDRFDVLVEAMEKSRADSMFAQDSAMRLNLLPSDKIMLARRDGTWLQSDPQQMRDWVEQRTARYGTVYLRLCRFFKGWRDHTWSKSKLSSICIMTAIDTALLDLSGLPSDNRDDELILEVAKRLPDIFRENVANPVISHLCLNEWDEIGRSEIIEAAQELKQEMISALEHTGDAERVVQRLQSRFGRRIPYRPDAVKMMSQIAAIEATTPAKTRAPQVIKSTSG